MNYREQIVYISCLEEVKYSFVSHLSEALIQKRIFDVFVDSEDLLSKEAQEKVEKARVSVVVLPGNGTVCLDKLVKVLKYQRNNDQVVVPVLYSVRTLEGKWLSALESKGFSSVHHSRKECSDSKLVNEIVEDVYEKLFHMERIGIYSKLLEIEKMVSKKPFGIRCLGKLLEIEKMVSKKPFGIRCLGKLPEIEKMVSKKSFGIRCLGIWGMPGIGKTTFAKAVFDQMSDEFDACCFIEDYDKSIHEKGLYQLLEEQFLKEKPGADYGTITALSLLRNKLNNKRVLVVLDDVRKPLVAEPFLGGFGWFGPESLIIITSTDKQVLRLCGVNHIYEVRGLNEKEALQLFLQRASIKDMAEQSLHVLTMKVIKHANGHPLALGIYSRELKKHKRKLSQIETAFLKLKRRPPFEIVDAFKSSYDTLSDSEKNIFLDIACFFQGENVDYVMHLLEGCGFFPHVGVDVLVGKSLVTVSENRVWMHNLIKNVGREIINGETVQIERRSRLWEPLIIKYLLEHKANVEPKTTIKRPQGTEEIQGIFLDTSNLSFDVNPDAFENMLKLRLLKIYCSNPETNPVISFSKGFLHSLPNELRLLHWENYPLRSLPRNFDPRNLVEINMPHSQLKKLWGGTKNLEMLRTIKLCHSQRLVDIEIVSEAQNLEVIDLQGCIGLQSFPATGQLLNLRVVNLSGCTEIKTFPEFPPNIETLHLQGTGIIELPHSVVKSNGGEILSLLAGIEGLSDALKLERITSLMKMSSAGHCGQDLGKLIFLDLKDCSRLQSLPNMVNLESLKVLDLSGCSELNTIQGFPRNLKELNIAGTAVREVPQLPQSLELLYAHGCVYLESFSLDSEKLPMHYTFSNCVNLSPQVVNEFLVKSLAYVKHMPREHQQELNKSPAFSFCAPSHTDQNSALGLHPGGSVMTRLNPSWNKMLVGFAMLVEVEFSEDLCDVTGLGISCVCRWKTAEGNSQRIERNLQCWDPGKAVPKFQKDHIFVFCDVKMRPTTRQGNDPDIWSDLVVFEFFPVDKQKKRFLDDICRVKRCGVYEIDDATCNTSLKMSSPGSSTDPMEVSSKEVEEVLRVSYNGLSEMNKVLFLYMACLFNDDDVDLVAPLIASSIDLDVNSGLKVLADKSLIHISSNGEIGMHYLLRRMGKEILHTESMLPSSSKDSTTDLGMVDRMALYSSGSSKCNVSLSFHRQDIRINFLRHLIKALEDRVIPTFKDGEIKITQAMQKSQSNISIILFTTSYASSSWLLNVLVENAKSNEDLSNIVIPIFHPSLDPSDVREQTGEFGRLFEQTCKNKTEDEIQRWRRALTDIASIAGYNIMNCDSSDLKFVNSMVEEAKELLARIRVRRKPSREVLITQGVFLVPARSLDITHWDNPKLWTWCSIYDKQSEGDIEIATLIKIYWLQMKGYFHTRKLTPGTKYEVVFMVNLKDTAFGWEEPVTVKLKLKYRDGSQSLQESTLCLNGYIRDNWVDIPAGEFEVRPENGAEIFFSLHQYMDTYQKSGLMVKGVALRPK